MLSPTSPARAFPEASRIVSAFVSGRGVNIPKEAVSKCGQFLFRNLPADHPQTTESLKTIFNSSSEASRARFLGTSSGYSDFHDYTQHVDKTRPHLITVFDHENRPLGVATVTTTKDGNEIRLLVADEHKCKGIGRELLYHVQNHVPGKKVMRAEENNEAALKLINGAFDFDKEETDGQVRTFINEGKNTTPSEPKLLAAAPERLYLGEATPNPHDVIPKMAHTRINKQNVDAKKITTEITLDFQPGLTNQFNNTLYGGYQALLHGQCAQECAINNFGGPQAELDNTPITERATMKFVSNTSYVPNTTQKISVKGKYLGTESDVDTGETRSHVQTMLYIDGKLCSEKTHQLKFSGPVGEIPANLNVGTNLTGRLEEANEKSAVPIQIQPGRYVFKGTTQEHDYNILYHKAGFDGDEKGVGTGYVEAEVVVDGSFIDPITHRLAPGAVFYYDDLISARALPDNLSPLGAKAFTMTEVSEATSKHFPAMHSDTPSEKYVLKFKCKSEQKLETVETPKGPKSLLKAYVNTAIDVVDEHGNLLEQVNSKMKYTVYPNKGYTTGTPPAVSGPIVQEFKKGESIHQLTEALAEIPYHDVDANKSSQIDHLYVLADIGSKAAHDVALEAATINQNLPELALGLKFDQRSINLLRPGMVIESSHLDMAIQNFGSEADSNVIFNISPVKPGNLNNQPDQQVEGPNATRSENDVANPGGNRYLITSLFEGTDGNVSAGIVMFNDAISQDPPPQHVA
ncbi:MAG: GNAT family N-acetyltransferase [Alphaproteobacteria bacterium]|nr:GNAT family N-acetyltransferase [Alphaproteobacteria bacterium]